ncbi:MAG: UDP-N-acetylmuramoyl-L-alanyl-D-glutamate--2,6-diaminopimelate ligase [Opitutae bacterium]|nr:UDP-N-acetylmuramoyl-L-alanyl-D-glutamate--2,6-diaminopimelate ligase [Opitutae bacterium]
MKTAKQIFEKIPEAKILSGGDVAVNMLVADSRRVIPGALFFALDGMRCCGADFVPDALSRGAVGVVARQQLDLPPEVAQIVVPDVRKALALAARAFFDDPAASLRLVGVTGTNGKTSVSSIVRFLMMSRKDAPWGLIGTVRYELGARSVPSYRTTPESLDLISFFSEMRDSGCEGAVMEVSSHAIDQDRIYGIPFNVVAFTNLTQDHMDYHHDMESYFAVKSRLFDGTQGFVPDVAVINSDDAHGVRLLEKLAPATQAVSFGTEDESKVSAATYLAKEISLGAAGSEFLLACPSGNFRVKTALPGHYNVSNVLCALAIVGSLGGDVGRAVADLKNFCGVPGRMERVPDNPFPFDVFVDYAHTDDALSNALSMLKKIAKGRLLVVFGCGGNRDRGKRPKMVRAVQRLADFAWATSDNPRKEPIEQIFDDMKAGISAPEKIAFEPNRRRAISLAIDDAKPGDIVLIAGKGHETYQEFADTTLPFDDKNVARELLELRSCRA